VSRDYRGEKIIIYPAYFDKRLSRRLGRRIPQDLAVPSPRLEEIYKAAEELGLQPLMEEDKAYPRVWFLTHGRIIISKKASKTELLKNIAEKIIINRRKKHHSL